MSEAASTTRSARWAVRGAMLASIALTCAAVTGVVLDRLESLSAPVPTVLGLRLGASVDEVRERRAGEGWTTRVDQSGDLVVERPDEVYGFHEGLLVAVDVVLAGGAADAVGPDRVISPGSVLARERAGVDRVRVRLVSRTCPTHRELADRLVGD